MINKVLNTIFSRLTMALLSFGIIIITSKQLGAEAVGTISLIVLAITIIQLANSLVGGPALVYLVPRFDAYKLFVPSVVWAFLTSVICSIILFLLGLIPAGYFTAVMVLSLLQSLWTLCMNVLLGKEKLKFFNAYSAFQSVLMIGILSFMVFYLGKKEIRSYIVSMYISYSVVALFGLVSMAPAFKRTNLRGMKEVMQNIFKFGSLGLVANVIQLFNYRFTYYLIESILGRASLGIYSVGVQLSEGLWLPGKSMAIVQYSRISNSNDPAYAKKITLVFAKISLLVTFVCLVILLLIPHQLFSGIFGKDFHDLPVVILSLGSGILFLSLSFSFSHYFSGTGRYHHNSISSAIGFVLTLALGFTLIPAYGLVGAGITTSAAYLSILTYQIIVFLHFSQSKLKELMILPSDIRFFAGELKAWIRKGSPKP
jgi:O-antigen/teichoic acid export membrane protein